MPAGPWGKREDGHMEQSGGSHARCPASHGIPGRPVLLFSQGQDSWFRKLPARPPFGDTVGQGLGSRDQPPSLAQPLPRYPLADEQAVGVLDGGSLVQQQRLELVFLDVIEGVKYHGQKLSGKSRDLAPVPGGASRTRESFSSLQRALFQPPQRKGLKRAPRLPQVV